MASLSGQAARAANGAAAAGADTCVVVNLALLMVLHDAVATFVFLFLDTAFRFDDGQHLGRG